MLQFLRWLKPVKGLPHLGIDQLDQHLVLHWAEMVLVLVVCHELETMKPLLLASRVKSRWKPTRISDSSKTWSEPKTGIISLFMSLKRMWKVFFQFCVRLLWKEHSEAKHRHWHERWLSSLSSRSKQSERKLNFSQKLRKKWESTKDLQMRTSCFRRK